MSSWKVITSLRIMKCDKNDIVQYNNFCNSFLVYKGNQIGEAMPAYIAEAAAVTLNKLNILPEGW